MSEERRYEAIVIGSGFAGAVTACRLAEAGKQVLMLERGRRYQKDDFPLYPTGEQAGAAPAAANGEGADPIPDFSRTFWKLGQGLWDVRDLGDVVAVQAAGFGGGSLIYANVHLRAPAEIFEGDWPEAYDRQSLDPYYDLAAHMLEVEPLPQDCALPKTGKFSDAAKAVGGQAIRVPLAVNFTKQSNRFGMEQSPCDMRGDCCFGCGQGAKNTLDLNYLELAQRGGESGAGRPAEVETLAEVVAIERRDDGSYTVRYRDRLYGTGDALEVVHAPHVFLCAGAVNSTELLMKSRAAGLLLAAPNELGARYYPNCDTPAAVFDCDGLQEADRGPTITSTLLYDAAPRDDDERARWHLDFSDGQAEPPRGSEIRGATSGARGELERPPVVRADSWFEHTATGELLLSRVQGSFQPGEELVIEGTRFARADSVERKGRHWLLVQDAGLPGALEPTLGVFRSPLWMRRNRFYEEQETEPEGRTPRPPYAELPFRSLADLAIGLPGGPGHIASLPTRFVTDAALGFRSDPAQPASKIDLWTWIPEQLEIALRHERREMLDRIADSSEPFVNASLDDIAQRIKEKYEIEDLLKGLSLPGLDAGDVGQRDIVRYGLQLAIEAGFGSQALLARYVASRLLASLAPAEGQLGKRLFDVFRWAADYRHSNSRTALLLSMGRDSLPGRLTIDVLGPPPYGSRIVGGQSGATGILVRTAAEGAWATGAARGSFVLSKLDTIPFVKGEPLLDGERRVGVLTAEEIDLARADLAEYDLDISALTAVGFLRLSVLSFAPELQPAASLTATDAALLDLAAARVRAALPDAFERPERAVQERLLRDLAGAWKGELRTNPISRFMGRELTVHSQGGCPMSRHEDQGVTRANGEVRGCPGLFVMDAAAFPTSVGVNPSATILAVAEYKVEQFLQAHHHASWRAEQYEAASRIDDFRRAELDPLGRAASIFAQPLSEPLGLEFDEVMEGRCSDPHDEYQVTTRLHATILDLTGFLEHDRRRGPQQIALTGTTTIENLTRGGAEDWELAEGSHMLLFSDASKTGGKLLRQIRYDMDLEQRRGGVVVQRRRLEGEKNLRDDECFDVWEDTATLATRISEPGGAWAAEGTLRVPAKDFFDKQVRSFQVTNTNDRARQSWGLAAFAKFFFGHLVEVYIPELDRVMDVAKNLVERSHD